MSGSLFYQISERMDKSYNLLSHIVTRSGFRAEYKRARIYIEVGILFESVIQIEYMQRVEKLTFILVQSLYLNVENTVGVEHRAEIGLDIFGETLFVFLLISARRFITFSSFSNLVKL